MKIRWLVIAAIGVLTAGAGIAHYADAPALLAFVVATAALAGLAWIVSFATEQVGERFGPAVTGVLQSTDCWTLSAVHRMRHVLPVQCHVMRAAAQTAGR